MEKRNMPNHEIETNQITTFLKICLKKKNQITTYILMTIIPCKPESVFSD